MCLKEKLLHRSYVSFAKSFWVVLLQDNPGWLLVALLRKECSRSVFVGNLWHFQIPHSSPWLAFSLSVLLLFFLGCPYLKVRSASIAAFRILSTVSPHFIWISKQKYNFPCLLSYIFKCFDAFQKFEFNQTYLTAAAPLALVNIGWRKF